MSPIDDLAGAVRAARARAGLTQAGLAAACGLARQTVTQVEAGRFSDLGIRKVLRVLERLGLGLRVERVAAGAAGGTRLRRLFRARAEARRAHAARLAATALRRLRRAGVAAHIVGSLARNKFRADSDVDFLVEDRGGLSEARVAGLIEGAMGAFPFDVVFAERADPVLLELMREEARGGARALRAA